MAYFISELLDNLRQNRSVCCEKTVEKLAETVGTNRQIADTVKNRLVTLALNKG
ncbi:MULTISPECIES: hypothetical protein [unclassified Erwinia]|uniref:hypothetical protein n=1 Tax=unclassified Erwinia TaxID=2622719 RepID=UPI00130427E6|nr:MULTISPECIES: hypothetical protein [unclassified Erwinia]